MPPRWKPKEPPVREASVRAIRLALPTEQDRLSFEQALRDYLTERGADWRRVFATKEKK